MRVPLALVINSHSSNEDCLKIFFSQLEKHLPINIFEKIYLFIDNINEVSVPSYVNCVLYDPDKCFTDQMIYCLSQVTEKYLLNFNEDYLFYEDSKPETLSELIKILEESNLSYVRFVYTDIEKLPLFHNIEEGSLLYISSFASNCYSQTLSLWKTEDLLAIHEKGPKASIGERGNLEGHFEILARETVGDLNIQGLVVRGDDPKRGLYHYDSSIFPHIATALVKGKWNLSEYPELSKILNENNINVDTRGFE